MSGTANNGAGSEGKKKKVAIVLVIALIVIVIALVGVIAYLLGKGNSSTNDSTAEKATREVSEGSARVVLDESDTEDVIEQMREEVAEGMFECQMSMDWTFQDGDSESADSYVANSVNNTHPIYFDVSLEDSDEILYSSPVIPVGKDITNIKLNKKLDPGEYSAVVMYTLLDDETNQNEISKAGFIITITVLN